SSRRRHTRFSRDWSSDVCSSIYLVADTDVGEGAAHHHFVVAAPRAVGVEVPGGDAQGLQVQAGRRAGLDVAGGGNVIGGDRVAEDGQDARAEDIRRRLQGLVDAAEVGRMLHIGGRRIPG